MAENEEKAEHVHTEECRQLSASEEMAEALTMFLDDVLYNPWVMIESIKKDDQAYLRIMLSEKVPVDKESMARLCLLLVDVVRKIGTEFTPNPQEWTNHLKLTEMAMTKERQAQQASKN